VLARDGNIYGIPCNSECVLKIDIPNQIVTSIGSGLVGKQKWYGGLMCPKTGNIYGIPNCADSVIKIDVENQEVTTIGHGKCDAWGGWKWHGGVVDAFGNVIGIPAHADSILKIIPDTDEVYQFGNPLPTALNYCPSGTYKYGGAVVGNDGMVYALPSDADQVPNPKPIHISTLRRRQLLNLNLILTLDFDIAGAPD